MTDLGTTIAPKSDQLNADDLLVEPKTIRITKVSADPGSKEQPIAIYYDGDNGKPYKPCKSMRRVLVQVWGRKGDDYVGRRLTLYRDPSVLFGGVAVGGIRISHMSDIDRRMELILTASRASRKPFTVDPIEPEQKANGKRREGKTLEERATDAAAALATAKTVERLTELFERAADLRAELEGGGHGRLLDKVQAAYDDRKRELRAAAEREEEL